MENLERVRKTLKDIIISDSPLREQIVLIKTILLLDRDNHEICWALGVLLKTPLSADFKVEQMLGFSVSAWFSETVFQSQFALACHGCSS